MRDALAEAVKRFHGCAGSVKEPLRSSSDPMLKGLHGSPATLGVEQTLARLNRNRLAKDFEKTIASATA